MLNLRLLNIAFNKIHLIYVTSILIVTIHFIREKTVFEMVKYLRTLTRLDLKKNLSKVFFILTIKKSSSKKFKVTAPTKKQAKFAVGMISS